MTNQNDFVIDNGTGFAVRTDIQDALQALAGNSSGNSEPSVKYAYQWWADTNAGILKLRNSSNDGWIDMLNLDGTFVFDLEDGTASAPSLRFADNQNTGIFSPADNEIAFTCSGATRMAVTTSKGVLIGTSLSTEGAADADDLTIATSTNTGITIRSGTTNHGSLFFSDATSGNGEFDGFLQYSHNTQTMFIGVAETNHTLFSSAGLLVGGTATAGIAGGGKANITVGAGTSASSGITMRSATNDVGSIFFSHDATSGANQYRGYVQYQHANDQLFFGTQTIARVKIEDSGNNGDVHVITGNVVFDTASKGLDFSATGNGGTSTPSEIFSDYEVGTWTPAYQDGTSLTLQSATYVKVGHLVMVQAYLVTGTNSSSNFHVVTGLPYASRNGANFFIGSMYMQTGGTVTDHKFVQVNNNATSMQILKNNGDNITLSSGSGGYVLFTVTYRAADGGS